MGPAMGRLRDPILLIPLLFAAAILVGAIILSLPFATSSGQPAPVLTAVFTSTSAVAVTGLIVEDTPVYWSPFEQAVILVLFQIGGFGIMTAATLFGLMVGRGFGVRDHVTTQVERSRLATATFSPYCASSWRSPWRWKPWSRSSSLPASPFLTTCRFPPPCGMASSIR